MELKEVLKADCEKVENLINIESVKILNILVTEPEKYSEYVKGENTKDRKEIQKLVEKMTNLSPKYTEHHKNDSHSTSQIENLENLLETELYYKCRENNDFISLTSEIMFRITQGHPFEEGNKRTAFLAGSLFAINHQLQKTEPEKVAIPHLDSPLLETLEDVADNEINHPKEITRVIRPQMVKQLKGIGYT